MLKRDAVTFVAMLQIYAFWKPILSWSRWFSTKIASWIHWIALWPNFA